MRVPCSFRSSDLSTCLCSVWTGQPHLPPAASTLPVSPGRGERGLRGESGEVGKASSKGCRACQATSCAAIAVKRLPAGLPSTWECCSASSVQGSTGNWWCSMFLKRHNLFLEISRPNKTTALSNYYSWQSVVMPSSLIMIYL